MSITRADIKQLVREMKFLRKVLSGHYPDSVKVTTEQLDTIHQDLQGLTHQISTIDNKSVWLPTKMKKSPKKSVHNEFVSMFTMPMMDMCLEQFIKTKLNKVGMTTNNIHGVLFKSANMKKRSKDIFGVEIVDLQKVYARIRRNSPALKGRNTVLHGLLPNAAAVDLVLRSGTSEGNQIFAGEEEYTMREVFSYLYDNKP